MQKDICIVILTYHRPFYLEKCLLSIFEDISGRENIDVLIINNGDDIETKKVIEKFPVRVIQDRKRSKGYLRNLGWQNSGTNIIAYVDDDVEIAGGWTESILELFAKFPNKNIGAITGPCIVKGRQLMVSLYRQSHRNKLYNFLFGLYNNFVCEGNFLEVGKFFRSGIYSIGGSLEESLKCAGPKEIEIMSSCNMAVKREVLELTGGFDEDFIYNHEDGDLSLRIRKNGYKLFFNPKMSVDHFVSPAKHTRTSSFFMGRDFGYFYRKHIRIRNLKDLFGLSINILLLNTYWIIGTVKNRTIEPLRGIKGLETGFKLSSEKK